MPAVQSWGNFNLCFFLLFWVAIPGGQILFAQEPANYRFEMYVLRFTGDDPGLSGLEPLLRQQGAILASIPPMAVKAGVACEIKEGKEHLYATGYTQNGTPDRWSKDFVGTKARILLGGMEGGVCRGTLDFTHVGLGVPHVIKTGKNVVFMPSFERFGWEDMELELKPGQWQLFNLPAFNEKNVLVAMRILPGGSRAKGLN